MSNTSKSYDGVLDIRRMMEDAIHDRLVDLVAEKRDEIEHELAQELDSITLSILGEYDIEATSDRLIIIVNKGGLDE